MTVQGESRIVALAVGVLFSAAIIALLQKPDDAENPALAPLTGVTVLRFTDAADGSIRALHVPSGEERARFESGTNGFARGLLRGLSRERRLHGIDQNEPFLLGRTVDGRLTLRDPTLATDIVLDAFGSTNRDVFRQLTNLAIAHRGEQP
ncbi:MAG: photosynthetic complex assembly protein PuhC [Pseudomonadota bacterium]